MVVRSNQQKGATLAAPVRHRRLLPALQEGQVIAIDEHVCSGSCALGCCAAQIQFATCYQIRVIGSSNNHLVAGAVASESVGGLDCDASGVRTCVDGQLGGRQVDRRAGDDNRLDRHLAGLVDDVGHCVADSVQVYTFGAGDETQGLVGSQS